MFLNILNALHVAMGYYMGMAFAKLQQQKEKDRMLQSRKSRGTDTDEDKNDRQKKCLYFHTFEVFPVSILYFICLAAWKDKKLQSPDHAKEPWLTAEQAGY